MEQTVSIVNNSSPRCPYCHESVEISSSKTACESCMAWHHKECWQEHGGCSACGTGVTEQSSEIHEVTETAARSTCVHGNCEELVQTRSSAHGYRLRCMNHAVKYGQDKVRSQELALLVLIVPTLLSFLGCLALLFIGNDSENPFVVYPALCVVTMVIVYNAREGHRKRLKSLQGNKSEKTSEKGAGKNSSRV